VLAAATQHANGYFASGTGTERMSSSTRPTSTRQSEPHTLSRRLIQIKVRSAEGDMLEHK